MQRKSRGISKTAQEHDQRATGRADKITEASDVRPSTFIEFVRSFALRAIRTVDQLGNTFLSATYEQTLASRTAEP